MLAEVATTRSAESRERNRRLALARAGWLATAALVVWLYALGLPALIGQIDAPCTGPDCPYYRLDAPMAESLSRLGLSVHAFEALVVGVDGLPMLVSLAVSALLVWRRADDGMALFAAFMLTMFVGAVLQSSITALSDDPVWRWPVAVVQCAGSVSILSFLCVFPDGRCVPRWTRWLIVGWIAWCVLGYFSPADWPVNQGPPNSVFPTGVVPFFVATVAAQVYRYHRVADEPQRQQTKWVLFGFGLGLTAILMTILVLPRIRPAPPDPAAAASLIVGGIGLDIALLLIPVSICLAVLRYGLFEIDLIISRTLLWTALTAAVIALYILVVGYLGALFRTGGNLPISVFAAGLVAVAWQPLRERLQRGINRLVYGERDDPYRVLSQLGGRLQGTVVPDALLLGVVQTVVDALRLPYAEIVLSGSADRDAVSVARCGEPTRECQTFALIYANEQVGELRVAPRRGTSGFGAADRTLLNDVARHAGAAAQAARLSADLQRSRERLVAAREEERRRLRRDLHDGLGPALAAQALKLGSARALYERDRAAADALLLQLENDMEAVLQDVRRLAYGLRPPSLDQLGLDGALRDLAARYAPAVAPALEIKGDLTSLPAGVEVAAYRITDEALTNIVRHASATRCRVQVERNGSLRLEIEDDGVGVPEDARPGIGLTSMRERAEELGGNFRVEGRTPRGTRIVVDFPLVSTRA